MKQVYARDCYLHILIYIYIYPHVEYNYSKKRQPISGFDHYFISEPFRYPIYVFQHYFPFV